MRPIRATLTRDWKVLKMRMFPLLFALLAGPAFGPAFGHEFWLEPTFYSVPLDGSLEAQIVNGQHFEGIKLAYIAPRIVRFSILSGDHEQAITMRNGDTPGLVAAPLADGLHIVVYQSTTATVDYETWEKFQSFIDHKDLHITLADHLARGLPKDGFKEVYSRFSKTLIGVGTGAGMDRRTGLETEIVALTNPYTDDLSSGVRVQLFYRDAVRANEQIEIFDKAPDGTVITTVTRTDAEGIATIPVTSGHSYMLDAVVLREPTPALAASSNGVWETLWANLTFAAP